MLMRAKHAQVVLVAIIHAQQMSVGLRYAMGDYACASFTRDYICAEDVGGSYACAMGFYKTCAEDFCGGYVCAMGF